MIICIPLYLFLTQHKLFIAVRGDKQRFIKIKISRSDGLSMHFFFLPKSDFGELLLVTVLISTSFFLPCINM